MCSRRETVYKNQNAFFFAFFLLAHHVQSSDSNRWRLWNPKEYGSYSALSEQKMQNCSCFVELQFSSACDEICDVVVVLVERSRNVYLLSSITLRFTLLVSKYHYKYKEWTGWDLEVHYISARENILLLSWFWVLLCITFLCTVLKMFFCFF